MFSGMPERSLPVTVVSKLPVLRHLARSLSAKWRRTDMGVLSQFVLNVCLVLTNLCAIGKYDGCNAV